MKKLILTLAIVLCSIVTIAQTQYYLSDREYYVGQGSSMPIATGREALFEVTDSTFVVNLQEPYNDSTYVEITFLLDKEYDLPQGKRWIIADGMIKVVYDARMITTYKKNEEDGWEGPVYIYDNVRKMVPKN